MDAKDFKVVIDEQTKISFFAIMVALPIVCAAILWIAAVHYSVVNAEKINEDQERAIQKNSALIIEHRDQVLHELFEIKGNVIEIRQILKQKE